MLLLVIPLPCGLPHLKSAAAGSLSYPSLLWGGWPAEGRSGGGSNNKIACVGPHPGLCFARLDPTRGRDDMSSPLNLKPSFYNSDPCPSSPEADVSAFRGADFLAGF